MTYVMEIGVVEAKREAVGYLKGRGGADTLTPDAAKAEWRDVFARMRADLDALELEVLAVEDALGDTARALNRSQPPMYRQMVVRWWKMGGWSGQRREPVMVRLEGGAGGRIKPVVAGRGVRLRTDRGFGLCADLAKLAVRDFWALSHMRKELATQVSGIGRSLTVGAARRGRAVAEVRERMAGIVREAEDRLRVVGYEVPGDEDRADE